LLPELFQGISYEQVAKNAWAYVMLQLKHVLRAKRCRTQWLSVIPLTKTPDNLQLESAFKTDIPACNNGSQTGEEYWPEYTYHKTILATNYSDKLISYLPDKAVPLLPCSWDTVTFAQAQPQLYEYRKDNGGGNKARLILVTQQESDELRDSFSYPTLSFVSNIFGIVGLYLGYGILDLYALGERLFVIYEQTLQNMYALASSKK
jgi:hypothetical protein